jgi:hypothetical protein
VSLAALVYLFLRDSVHGYSLYQRDIIAGQVYDFRKTVLAERHSSVCRNRGASVTVYCTNAIVWSPLQRVSMTLFAWLG